MAGNSRDYWAHNRTHLANERTLLAYWRTSVTFAGLGIALIKLISSAIASQIGVGFIILGALLFLYSNFRYLHLKKTINGEEAIALHTHKFEEEYEKVNNVVEKVNSVQKS